ncbi:hypothetical protein KCM76_23040 [Zooshikella marina]|uniref:hypothetical protein n=1 Tax=Zooshikella ganghwensis TaxID=202772 RepID=UPI001BB0145C|nr:hypothetical protein [Zooshikella ganghwensis]MBU2708889.1 hypothetical protein [Zooshikella ganghwensis]
MATHNSSQCSSSTTTPHNTSHHNHNSWHIDKTFNIGNLLTVLPVVIALFTWGTGVETRITKNTTNISNIEDIIREDKLLRRNEMSQMNSKFDQMSSKMDSRYELTNSKLDRILELRVKLYNEKSYSNVQKN